MDKQKTIMGKLYEYRHKKACGILILCIISLLCCLSCVVIYLLRGATELIPEHGVQIFRMFTVDSNVFMSFACACAIPFIVEGMRKDRIHLPTWCLRFVYMGVTGVAVTMFFTLVFIFPFQGYELAFKGFNLYFHIICPLIDILLFTTFASDHRINIKESLLSMSFFTLYAIGYIVNVAILGNWRDAYQLTTTIPLWISFPMMFLVAFGVSRLLAFLHNRTCKKAETEAVTQIRKYVEIPEGGDITSMVREIARETELNPHIVQIPVDDLRALAEVMETEISDAELSRIYLEGYYEK